MRALVRRLAWASSLGESPGWHGQVLSIRALFRRLARASSLNNSPTLTILSDVNPLPVITRLPWTNLACLMNVHAKAIVNSAIGDEYFQSMIESGSNH